MTSSGPVVVAFAFLLRLRVFRSPDSYTSSYTSHQLLEEEEDSFSSYKTKDWDSSDDG